MADLKRSAIGLVILISVLLITIFVVGLFSPIYHPVWSPTVGLTRLLLAIVAGSYYARGAFLVPAVSFVSVVWLVSLIASIQYRLPEEQFSFLQYAIRDALSLFTSLVVAVVGVYLGARLSRQKMRAI